MKLDVKLLGFSPDYDISIAGVVTGGTGFVPTINGLRPVKSLTTSGFPALPSTCKGAAVVRLVDDSRRIFVGTQTKLYEGTGLVYNDVSSAPYTGGVDNRWRYAQFGNDTIATNFTDPVQVSTTSGSFANLAGSPPKAAMAETCSGFVLLFDYNDGTNIFHDGWWCSALQNDTSWSPSIATQAANGRLLDTPGSIRAAHALGNNMVVYKERSMYFGVYQGPPVIWSWQLIPGEVGAVSQEAVVNVLIEGSPAQIFAGYDDFYIFDGTKPVSIGNPLRKWYNTNSNAQWRYRTQALHDPANQVVYFYLPDSSGNLTLCVPYNYKIDKWGTLGTISPIEAALQYLSPGTTYNGLGSLYTTYDSLPPIPYDAPFWTSGAPVAAVFDSTHTLDTYSGTPGATSINCGYSGDGDQLTTLTRVRPRFNVYPTTATCNVLYTQNLGDPSPLTVATSSLNNGKMDVLKSSKWFAPQFSFTGDYEITGYSLIGEQDGEE